MLFMRLEPDINLGPLAFVRESEPSKCNDQITRLSGKPSETVWIRVMRDIVQRMSESFVINN